MVIGWLPESVVYADLAAILLLGLPHGALDVELARERFNERSPRLWFFKFGIPYLALSAMVLVCWHIVPLTSLGIFLILSIYHFGREQTSNLLGILVGGSAPIALAICLSPAETLQIFTIVTGVSLTALPDILRVSVLAWMVFAGLWTIRHLLKRNFRVLALGGVLILLYYMVDTLTALTLYFVFWHAPLHIRRLIDSPHFALRISGFAAATRLSLGPSALTLLLGLILWPLYPGPPAERLLMLTIQGLAALTLPHMLFDYWLAHDRRKQILRSTGRSAQEAVA
jgi:Brp/Blh family beta-carotene 15,15'-monooxygenase